MTGKLIKFLIYQQLQQVLKILKIELMMGISLVRSQTVEKINSYSFDGEAVLTVGDGVGTGKIFHYICGKFDFHQRVYKISHFSNKLNAFIFICTSGKIFIIE